MEYVLYYNCSKGNGTLSFKTLEWGLKTLNPLLGRRSGSRHNQYPTGVVGARRRKSSGAKKKRFQNYLT